MLERKDSHSSLFDTPAFAGFGPTHLHPPEFQPAMDQVRGRAPSILKNAIREKAPKLPGIYGMMDARDMLIYVGKAKSLRSRLLSYFRTKSRDPKAGKIIARTRKIVWETTPNEFSALLRELEQIQINRPRFNVIGQPGMRRYVYMCIGRTPAPTLYATTRPTGKELACFGPFSGSRRVTKAARFLNDLFRLRDCSQKQKMHFADQPSLFDVLPTPGCIRFEISTCSGPCVGGCSRRGYSQQIKRAKEFMQGTDIEPIQKLEREMIHLAENLEFERASTVKEKLDSLSWLRERLGFLQRAREEHSFVYSCTGLEGRPVWYIIHRGVVTGARFEPRNKKSREKLLAEIAKSFTDPLRVKQSALRCFDSVLLVAAWFRKYPQERDKLLMGEGNSTTGRTKLLPAG